MYRISKQKLCTRMVQAGLGSYKRAVEGIRRQRKHVEPEQQRRVRQAHDHSSPSGGVALRPGGTAGGGVTMNLLFMLAGTWQITRWIMSLLDHMEGG